MISIIGKCLRHGFASVVGNQDEDHEGSGDGRTVHAKGYHHDPGEFHEAMARSRVLIVGNTGSRKPGCTGFEKLRLHQEREEGRRCVQSTSSANIAADRAFRYLR